MKKFIFVIFIALLGLLNIRVLGQVQLHPAWDNSSYDSNTQDLVRADYWTLLPQWKFEYPFTNMRLRLFWEVPAIGVRKSTNFEFRQKLFILNMNEHAFELMSGVMRRCFVRNNISKLENMAAYFAMQKSHAHKFKICAVITGKGCKNDECMIGKKFDFSYHGFLSKFQELNSTNFRSPVSVGLFEPMGLKSTQKIKPERSLTDTLINDEARTDFPVARFLDKVVQLGSNNKYPPRLKYQGNRMQVFTTSEASSCWTWAVVFDKSTHEFVHLITYHLLLNSRNLSDAVQHAINNNKDFCTKLSAIEQVATVLKLDEYSKGVIIKWVSDIGHISKFEAANDSDILSMYSSDDEYDQNDGPIVIQNFDPNADDNIPNSL
ncbi:hypothetical protein P0136_02990 [Lentisphaerota bacterium ZTH]|nr:hypothetical protein JYG24_05870 [Lentisphaerota bacterium]WET06968.1 hypothetical protein P0136_02990 [Lentisphaerota bacterium ZTH]